MMKNLILIIAIAFTSSCNASGQSDKNKTKARFYDLRLVDTKYFPGDAAWVSRPTHLLEHLDGFVPGKNRKDEHQSII